MDEYISDTFRFCPRCGHEAEEPGGDPFSCGSCGFVLYFGPCAAVAGIVMDADGQVLLLRRAKDPGKGLLGLPGGFASAGESLEEALRRETLEETDLKIGAIEYLASFPNRYHFRGIVIPVADVFYQCRVDSFDAALAQEDEVDGFLITRPGESELGQMAFPSNRRALEIWLGQD